MSVVINQIELIQRSANNDPLAFKLLYDLTSPKLYSLVLKIIKREKLAEEALQESYIKIWHRANSYDPSNDSVIGWMSIITRNTAVDTLRDL